MEKTYETFFEIIKLGNAVKVTAIDADTGTEAVIQGPKSASQSDLKQLAKNKLDYIMKKNREEKNGT